MKGREHGGGCHWKRQFGDYSGGYTLRSTQTLSGANTAVNFQSSTGLMTGPALNALSGDNARTVPGQTKQYQSAGFVRDGGAAPGTSGTTFVAALTASGGVGGSPATNTPGLAVEFDSCDAYLPGLNLGNGSWHDLIVTLQGSTLNVYVDGVQPCPDMFGTVQA